MTKDKGKEQQKEKENIWLKTRERNERKIGKVWRKRRENTTE